MDEIDSRIIHSLIQNSRITLSQMSKDIDVPDATISNRLKKLEKDVIKQYTLILDYDKIDLKITAIIIIQSESEKHKDVERELSSLDEVSEVYSISGEYDILIKVWARSLDELNNIIKFKNTFCGRNRRFNRDDRNGKGQRRGGATNRTQGIKKELQEVN